MIVRTYNFNDNEFKVYFSEDERDFDIVPNFKYLEVVDRVKGIVKAVSFEITVELGKFLLDCANDLSTNEGISYRFVGVMNEQRFS